MTQTYRITVERLRECYVEVSEPGVACPDCEPLASAEAVIELHDGVLPDERGGYLKRQAEAVINELLEGE